MSLLRLVGLLIRFSFAQSEDHGYKFVYEQWRRKHFVPESGYELKCRD